MHTVCDGFWEEVEEITGGPILSAQGLEINVLVFRSLYGRDVLKNCESIILNDLTS
jgi:hypothetical protein